MALPIIVWSYEEKSRTPRKELEPEVTETLFNIRKWVKCEAFQGDFLTIFFVAARINKGTIRFADAVARLNGPIRKIPWQRYIVNPTFTIVCPAVSINRKYMLTSVSCWERLHVKKVRDKITKQ